MSSTREPGRQAMREYSESELASYEQTAWLNRQPHADCGGCQELLKQLAAAVRERDEARQRVGELDTTLGWLWLRLAMIRTHLRSKSYETAGSSIERAIEYIEKQTVPSAKGSEA